MCKAHVLRFRCGHGVLMGLDQCRMGPCPVIKTNGQGLPQQPYRCYNCQHKAEKESNSGDVLLSNTSRASSLTSSSSTDSMASCESTGSTSPTSLVRRPTVCDPLPNVAVQPSGCVLMSRPRAGTISSKSFSFTCNTSNHYLTPHYSDLPNFLPHQNHPCPPCQLESLRAQADLEAGRSAKAEFAHLREEMLVSDGRKWDPETMSKPSLEAYVADKRMEEKQVWVHVTRKWTQDLKKARVLVAEEDGLGLFG